MNGPTMRRFAKGRIRPTSKGPMLRRRSSITSSIMWCPAVHRQWRLAGSPSDSKLRSEIVRIAPAGSSDHIAYLVLDPFERGRPVPDDLPLHTQLIIHTG